MILVSYLAVLCVAFSKIKLTSSISFEIFSFWWFNLFILERSSSIAALWFTLTDSSFCFNRSRFVDWVEKLLFFSRLWLILFSISNFADSSLDKDNFAALNFLLRFLILWSVSSFFIEISDCSLLTLLNSESIILTSSLIIFLSSFVFCIELRIWIIVDSSVPLSSCSFSRSDFISGNLDWICSNLFLEVSISLFSRSDFWIDSVSSESIVAFAWLYALTSSMNFFFWDSSSWISFLKEARSSSNFLISDVKACKFRSFDIFVIFRVLSLLADSIALNLLISFVRKSFLSCWFRSSSNSSIRFLISPIFAKAISNLLSASSSCFTDSLFFSSKSDSPIKSSMDSLFSSEVNSEILVTVPCCTLFNWCKPALARLSRSRTLWRWVFFLSIK